MRYADEIVAMRNYLRTYDEIEQKRDEFPVGSALWTEYDGIMTAYMQMWSSRYGRVLNAPNWLWSDV